MRSSTHLDCALRLLCTRVGVVYVSTPQTWNKFKLGLKTWLCVRLLIGIASNSSDNLLIGTIQMLALQLCISTYYGTQNYSG